MALRVWKTEELTPLQAEVGAPSPWARPSPLCAGSRHAWVRRTRLQRRGKVAAAALLLVPGAHLGLSLLLRPLASPPQTRLRKAIYDSIHAFIAQYSLTQPRDIIDIGCSVGVSTRWLAADFPDAQVGRWASCARFPRSAGQMEGPGSRPGQQRPCCLLRCPAWLCLLAAPACCSLPNWTQAAAAACCR